MIRITTAIINQKDLGSGGEAIIDTFTLFAFLILTRFPVCNPIEIDKHMDVSISQSTDKAYETHSECQEPSTSPQAASQPTAGHFILSDEKQDDRVELLAGSHTPFCELEFNFGDII